MIKMDKVKYKHFWSLICLLVLQKLVVDVNGLEFEDAQDPNVEFTKKSDVYYNLKMNENVASATLFIIKDVKGNPYLKFSESNGCSAFSTGSQIDNGDEPGSFKLSLKTPLDYEQLNCQLIRAVIEDSAKSLNFELEVGNLNDNPPLLELLPTSNCSLQENTVYTKENTTCSLKMTDRDGMMEDTKFSIEESRHTNIFEADFQSIPGHDDKETIVVVYLSKGTTLDFEEMNLYVLSIEAKQDNLSGVIQIPINVKDMPDQPPKWTKMFTTQQFEENIDQEFYVKAVDGDVMINNDIYYNISDNKCDGKTMDSWKCRINIEDTGKITVRDVDREEVGDTLTLKIYAIEIDNSTSLDITFFIVDQDDEVPQITISPDEDNTVVIEKDENYVGTITTFSVKDMDLAMSGTFDIKLTVPKDSVDYTKAFQVIPTSGYQNGDFTLTVFNSSYLDYENEDWRKITFQLQAIERADASHVDSKSIIINLKDLNDEPPVFLDDTDSVKVPENIIAGEEIFNASAYDKDAGDIVTYQIMGVWQNKLDINKNGIVSTKMDEVFDYEQLQQVVVQIKASDNDEVHQTYKTLTINVIDVDDEPPSIQVGRNRITIKENSKSHTLIEDAEITVTDPDTKPKLKVEIDWSKSFITKNSGLVKADDDKWRCFDLKTEDHEENSAQIKAQLSINDICSPDFELFDAITISLLATDENTVKRSTNVTGSILVNIEDENDNAPEFLESSLTGLEVTDGTTGVSKIGTISAHDVDLNDVVTFSMKALDPEADWLEIDGKTGLLSVKEAATIDDDIPPRMDISYVIIACDRDNIHCPNVTVVINVNDINDQTPVIRGKTEKKDLMEKTTDGTVLGLSYDDKDRDVPFKTVYFRFDTGISNEAANCFKISQDGEISVSLRNGFTLDRDFGLGTYSLPILAYDNPNGTLQLTDRFDLEIVLLDKNDHTPVIVNKSIECSENLKKNSKLGPIVAEDPDEGDNARVKFEIVDITPFSQQNPQVLTKSLLSISSIDDKTATITLLGALEGYYGKYNLTILTADHGQPLPNFQNNIIEFAVTKFNFKAPVFIFPYADSMKIILQKDQVPGLNSAVKLYNGTVLRDIEIDDQQNHKWEVAFEVLDSNGHTSKLFSVIRSNYWKAKLQLLSNPDDTDEQTIIIQASVKNDQQEGEKPISISTHLKISFFSSDEQPEFAVDSFTISFEENSLGSPQSIKQATFPSGLDIQPYYFLLDNTDIFQVDPQSGSVSLKVKVDYEEITSFEIRVGASSTVSPGKKPSGKSVLNVHVNIIDLNDNIPIFFPSKFVGAFLKSYSIHSTILTVNATDADPSDCGKLHFDMSEVTCTDNLKPPNPAFQIGENDGKITPTFSVTSDMSGYCNFNVSVADNPDTHGTVHNISTTVQINIISDEELVSFTFLNDDTYISQQQENITDAICAIFKTYDYLCYLAELTYNQESMNTTADFFFLDQNMSPIKGSEILGNLSDIDTYTSLRKSLLAFKVYLGNFSPPAEEVGDHIKIWLFATTFIMGTLLILLSIVFFFRNRALTQRINNLSTTKFGSQDSGLNRAGVAAPNTNRNAMEGSNPVFNSENFVKEMDPDRNSIISSDSDLFGVEDNPEFDCADI